MVPVLFRPSSRTASAAAVAPNRAYTRRSMCGWRTLQIGLCLLVLLLCISSAKVAYVSLVLNEPFVAPARVLGLSLASTGTAHDRVLLYASGLSKSSLDALQNDGWKTKEIQLARFRFIFSKLRMFSLTEYERVVYLDADITVEHNIDELFSCGKFCAVLRNSNFNSGVMVVSPNITLYEELQGAHRSLASYNGGEQGFMNSFFPRFAHCPLFDPTSPNASAECTRLPGIYNGDIGLYYTNANHWTTPPPKVIHYTLGDLKPWNWWAVAVLPDVAWLWWQKYARLAPASDSSNRTALMVAAPILFYIAVAFADPREVRLFRLFSPLYRLAAESFVCRMLLLVALSLGDVLVVTVAFYCLSGLFVTPLLGWLLMLEWCFVLLLIVQLSNALLCEYHAKRCLPAIVPRVVALTAVQVSVVAVPIALILRGQFAHLADRALVLGVSLVAFAALRVGSSVYLAAPLTPHSNGA